MTNSAMRVEALTPATTPKLRLTHISHSFQFDGRSPLPVLSDITLDVKAGEFLAIVGGSGSGKTTLLRIIDHLLKASKGEVLVDGAVVARPGERISFVFQQDRLLPWRRVLGNATYGLELRGAPLRQANETARRYLALVGLAGFENYYPHQLSGGMRQRVNLAPRARDGAGHPPDGRAIRGARRSYPRDDATGASAHLR